MTADPAALAGFFRTFADYSLGDGIPLYDAMVRAAADDPEIMALVAAAPSEAHVPNNLHAAARFLLLSGVDHPLAEAYEPGYAGDLGPLFRDLVLAHREDVSELLATRYVQTNEVNRCAAIAPCLDRVGARARRPLALVDVGCSAGFNLVVDRHRIELTSPDDHDDVVWARGPRDAALVITAENRGRVPDDEPAEIGWRRGIDRNPIDVTDEDDARWLEALVWPDHPERRARVHAAIDAVRADPPALVRTDALDGLRSALADAPGDHLVTVLTTWVVFYFDEELRRAFEATILDAGRPTAWVAMEMAGVVPGIAVPPVPGPLAGGEVSVMSLVSAGAGRPADREFLGFTHPHGAWVSLV